MVLNRYLLYFNFNRTPYLGKETNIAVDLCKDLMGCLTNPCRFRLRSFCCIPRYIGEFLVALTRLSSMSAHGDAPMNFLSSKKPLIVDNQDLTGKERQRDDSTIDHYEGLDYYSLDSFATHESPYLTAACKKFTHVTRNLTQLI